MKNKNYSTRLSTYDEANALQQLLETINEATSNERFERYEDDVMQDEIVISIAGKQTAFYLGGPQIAALHAFVDHIADENCYIVDYTDSTVQ